MLMASLPMYDLPETAVMTQAFWQGLVWHLRNAGIPEVPQAMTKGPRLPDHWLSARLLFSQTCGYPLTHALRGKVRLVATPCYSAPGCQGADYCSIVVVHRDAPFRTFVELRGKRAAYSSSHSHSGFNALRALAPPLSEGGRFFTEAIESGSHAGSLSLVTAGKADVAAIDCVTFALLKRYRPAAVASVRELCRSTPAPGLPYITSRSTGSRQLERLRQGLRAAMEDPSLAEVRSHLLLTGIRLLPETEYQRIMDMEAVALAHGCHAL